MKVVDPHIHLWDENVGNYPWLAKPSVTYSGDNRLLPQRYDVAALLADAHEIQILGSVNIEANPGNTEAEVQWLQSLADNPVNRGHPSGIVAYADLSRSDAPEVLERLSIYPNLRGVRQILNVHADPRYNYVGENYLALPQWRKNLERLARYGWSFDLQLYPAQAGIASEVINENPDIPFIINHAGMFVDRNAVSGWREWRSAIRALASFENTSIKLSGFAMFDHHWTTESFRPLVLEAIDCFGTERCMFASNFPIDRLHSSYTTLWHAYAEIVSGMNTGERQNLFIRNAIRHYRLRLLPGAEGNSWG